MNYRKFLESKLGSFIGKARFVRVLIMKLYIRQQNIYKEKTNIFRAKENQICYCSRTVFQRTKT